MVPSYEVPGLGSADAYIQQLRIQNAQRPAGISADRNRARVQLLEAMDADFVSGRPATTALSHQAAYRRAVTLMTSAAASAFDVEQEPAALRDRYGRNLFGQGCLLARRLIERGVPFVEVTLSGVVGGSWDTHRNNFENVRRLNGVLDPAWATLMADLQDKGLLDTTLIVWAGEFGRTPRINATIGRDHWATSWSTVLAGGGIRGGRVVGRTSADGAEVTERPVDSQDFLATIGRALGCRHHEAKRFQRRPADSNHRTERTSNPGGARMKRMWVRLGFVLLGIGLAYPAGGQVAKAKADAPSDVQDFVLFSDARPILVRLHVRIGDQPFTVVWNDFMRHLFDYLDINGDGNLDQN
jgi:hypothetical protein